MRLWTLVESAKNSRNAVENGRSWHDFREEEVNRDLGDGRTSVIDDRSVCAAETIVG